MSGVLLDTHAALWLVHDAPHLGPISRALVQAQGAWVSPVSLWEIEIKRSVGKLTVDADIHAGLAGAGVRELPLTWAHTRGYAESALAHRDPFDRMLVAQAAAQNLTFLTADRLILAASLDFAHDART